MIAEPFTLYLIVTDGTRPIEDIAKDLANVGLKNVAVLDQLNCITGKANPASLTVMLTIPGVTAIEPDMPVQLDE